MTSILPLDRLVRDLVQAAWVYSKNLDNVARDKIILNFEIITL